MLILPVIIFVGIISIYINQSAVQIVNKKQETKTYNFDKENIKKLLKTYTVCTIQPVL